MSSEAAVFFRLNRVPVCSEAELLIFIMTAKCKFTGEEKLLVISPHRKESLRRCRDFNLGEPEIKNIQHLPRFSIASPNADYAVYPRSAQAYADAGTSTWVNQKGYTTFAWIFTCVSKC